MVEYCPKHYTDYINKKEVTDMPVLKVENLKKTLNVVLTN